jgi:hypothetical protein
MKEDEMRGTCSTHGEMSNAYKIFIGKPEGTKQLGRSGCRWKDNINMDLLAQGTDWWQAVVNTVMKSWKFLDYQLLRDSAHGVNKDENLTSCHLSGTYLMTYICGPNETTVKMTLVTPGPERMGA